MAPLPVIEDVYRCALNWLGVSGSQNATNVLHIWDVTGGHDADWVNDRLQDHVTSNMWATTADGAAVNEIAITPLDGSSATRIYAPDTPANWDGGTGGDSIPSGAVLVSLATAQRGKSFRGRVYIPFLAEAAQDDGFLTGADVASQRTAWSNFVDDMAGANADLVVASYKLSLKGSVTSATIPQAVATQRRRQRRNQRV